MWSQLLFLLLAIGMVFLLYRLIKSNPESFSAKNLNKSLTTFCYIAFLMIAFIALLVYLMRH